MLVKTIQYKSSGISSANLFRALEIFDLPPAISPELNKCPGSNPVLKLLGVLKSSISWKIRTSSIPQAVFFCGEVQLDFPLACDDV